MRPFWVVALVALAACGGGSPDAATTTTICPTAWTMGDPHGADQACWPGMMESFASGHGVALSTAADEEARALCRRMDTSGTAGVLAALADWETGTASPTVDDADRGAFVPIAVGIYCPQHYPALRSSG